MAGFETDFIDLFSKSQEIPEIITITTEREKELLKELSEKDSMVKELSRQIQELQTSFQEKSASTEPEPESESESESESEPLVKSDACCIIM